MDHHLAVRAVLEGSAPGVVYVDDPAAPRSALVWIKMRSFLAGSADNATFNGDLHHLFADVIYPSLIESGKPMIVLYCDSAAWEDIIDDLLPGRKLVKGQRQYFECRTPERDRQIQPPHDFVLHHVDETLLGLGHLQNLDALKEEMCSERPTVQEFLDKSFGTCLSHGDEVIGWCLSEYNCTGRCEVGIEINETYQRQGLGTLLSLAMIEMARSHGITRIGWHCWSGNTPSVATALKAGFRHVADYPAYYLWLKE